MFHVELPVALPTRADFHSMAEPGQRKPRRAEPIAIAPLSREDLTTTVVAAEQTERAGNVPIIPPNYIPDGTGEWDYLMNKWDPSTTSHAQIHQATRINFDGQEPTVMPTVYQQLKIQPVADVEEEENGDVPDTANQGRNRRLVKEEVEGIINDMIAKYTEQWDQKDLHRLLPTERKSWLSAEKKGRRQLAHAKDADVDLGRKTLDRACDCILGSEWFSEKKLREQCGSLEILVRNLQTTSWEHGLYQRSSPPSEVELSMLEEVQDASDEEGVDSLDSEPEIGEYEDEDEFDDFIVKDEPSPVRASAPTEIIDLGSGSSDEEDCTQDPIPIHAESIAGGYTHPENFAQIWKQRSPVSIQVGSTEQRSTSYDRLPNRPARRQDDRPEDASFAAVAGWRWDDLVEFSDRNRVIMKLIQRMSEEERDMVRDRLSVTKHLLLAEISDCTEMLLRRESRMPGVLPRDQEKINKLTRLFLSWWLCDDYINQDPQTRQLEELLHCSRMEFHEPGIFYEWICLCMDRTFRKGSYSVGPPPGAEVIVLDSD